MIDALLIIIAVLLIALWISAMALWWHHEQGLATPLQQKDVIRQWNKAVRLGRRSWYGTMRYSKQAALWGNKKVSTAFIAVFPRSKQAFEKKDLLTGLEHGPSSYFLASISPISNKPKERSNKKIAPHRKKIIQNKPVSEETLDLSEE